MSQRVQGENAISRAFFNRLLGHAEDYATVLVLRESGGSCLLHFEQSLRAIISHPGQNDPYGVLARIAGPGTEQDIDGGTMSRDQWALAYFDEIACAAA